MNLFLFCLIALKNEVCRYYISCLVLFCNFMLDRFFCLIHLTFLPQKRDIQVELRGQSVAEQLSYCPLVSKYAIRRNCFGETISGR